MGFISNRYGFYGISITKGNDQHSKLIIYYKMYQLNIK